MGTSVGKGTMYLMIAQIVFLISGYVIHLGLGRYLGPSEYGIFSVVISLITVIDLILISGLSQAISKYIAEDERLAGTIKNKALKLQAIAVIITFFLYIRSARFIADILNDQSLIPYLKLSSLMIPVCAFSSIYVGCLNGLRYFKEQAISNIVRSVTKVAGVFVFVLIGWSISGAILGYICSIIAGWALAKHYLRIGYYDSSFKTIKLIKFAVPVLLISVGTSLLMNIDIFSVKSIIAENEKVGFYNAASMISRLPYFVLFALSYTLLPAVSKSTSARNKEQTKRYIRYSMRYMMSILLPIIFLISGTSDGLISLLYSSRYIDGASSLSILAFGFGFLTLFMILVTVITASEKQKVSMCMVLILVPIDVMLNRILIPIYQIVGAALATTITGLIGVVIAGAYVLLRFRTLMSLPSFIRISLSSLIIYFIALNMPIPNLLLPLEYAVLFGLYVVILWFTREVRKEDLQVLRGMLPDKYQELLPNF